MNRREILFRGKRVDNGEWVYGDYFNAASGQTIIENGGLHMSSFNFVDPSTIGQLHNALTRKAGSNVFVGDIIKYDLEAGLGQPKRIGLTETVRSVECDFHYYSNVRLLGNKFDNPELTQQS